MKYTVVHSIPGRMRIHTAKRCFSKGGLWIGEVVNSFAVYFFCDVNYRTGAILLEYEESCKEVLFRDLAGIRRRYCSTSKGGIFSSKGVEEKFEHNVFDLIFRRLAMRILFPSGIRNVMIIKKYLPFF